MTSEGERIAKLEARLDHLTETLDKMAGKVDELHALLLQARGFRWAIVAVASLSGFLAGKLSGIFSLFAIK